MPTIPIRQIRPPQTLTVSADGTAQYDLIQDANADAVSGDTILIYPGTYNLQLGLKAGVTYKGVSAGARQSEVKIWRTFGGASGLVLWSLNSSGTAYLENLDFQASFNGSAGDVRALEVTNGTIVATNCKIVGRTTTGCTGGNIFGARRTGGAFYFNNCYIAGEDTSFLADLSIGLELAGTGGNTTEIHGSYVTGWANDDIRVDNASANVWMSNCQLNLNGINLVNCNSFDVWGDNRLPAGTGIADDDTETVFEQKGYGKLLSNGQQDTYKLPLRGLTADPATLGDGMLWYRADTDNLHVRRNGVTETAVMTADTVAGLDSTAIHDDTAAEISAITEKTTPAAGDHILIEDSAAANAKKRITVNNLARYRQHSKSITIENPGASEDISMFFTNQAITIDEIRAVVRGTTPSVTWTVRHGTDRSAAGAEAVTGGTTTTSQTTGSDVTTFNDATVVADSFVWLETTAQTGTVNELSVTVIYKED